jgi:hypothetical protein
LQPTKKPCAQNQKIPCLESENPSLESKNPVVRIKDHLHPNKKPCARNQKIPSLESKNHLHPNFKNLVPGILKSHA